MITVQQCLGHIHNQYMASDYSYLHMNVCLNTNYTSIMKNEPIHANNASSLVISVS